MKLTKKQINFIVKIFEDKILSDKAKTSKDFHIIFIELFNEELEHLYDRIINTWKSPEKNIIKRLKKVNIIESEEFTM